jgi:hypothetical protein
MFRRCLYGNCRVLLPYFLPCLLGELCNMGGFPRHFPNKYGLTRYSKVPVSTNLQIFLMKRVPRMLQKGSVGSDTSMDLMKGALAEKDNVTQISAYQRALKDIEIS